MVERGVSHQLLRNKRTIRRNGNLRNIEVIARNSAREKSAVPEIVAPDFRHSAKVGLRGKPRDPVLRGFFRLSSGNTDVKVVSMGGSMTSVGQAKAIQKDRCCRGRVTSPQVITTRDDGQVATRFIPSWPPTPRSSL